MPAQISSGSFLCSALCESSELLPAPSVLDTEIILIHPPLWGNTQETSFQGGKHLIVDHFTDMLWLFRTTESHKPDPSCPSRALLAASS